jgi:hypothetical protein
MPSPFGPIVSEDVAKELIFGALMNHPLPWRVEDACPYDVVAPDGHILARCPEEATARNIIALAEEIAADSKSGPFEMLCL